MCGWFKVKIVMLMLVFTFIPYQLYAGWMRIYGGEDYDWGSCVRQTSGGEYIVVGTTTSFGAGEQDLWLLKIDAVGDTLWTRTFGTVERDKGFCVQQTADGGYIVSGSQGLIKTDEDGNTLWETPYGGYCVQQTSDGGYVVAATRNSSIWLIKTDQVGDTVWTNTFQTGTPYCVRQTSDAGYIITGETWGSDTSWLDLCLLKTDEQGSLLWTRTYGGRLYGDDRGNSVREVPGEGYIVTGYTQEEYEEGFEDLWLIKTDLAGNMIWNRIYGDEFDDWGNCVQCSADGGYVVVGIKYGGGDLPRFTKVWLIKTDELGYPSWERTFGEEVSNWGSFVDLTSDGGYIITGHTQLFAALNSELWLIKTDSLGYVGVEDEPVVDGSPGLKIVSSIGSQISLHFSDYPQGFRASIYDASGRKVDEIKASGSSGAISWGEGYTSGVYFIRSASGASSAMQKVVLLK